jgi:hypothetical protein
MQIVTPSEIEQVAWEGSLEPVGAVYKGLEQLPIVTIGEPAYWPAAEAVEAQTGQNWSPPADGRRYTLVRLDCTLHAPEDTRTRYSDATLTASLRPGDGVGTVIAHDLYPLRVVATGTQKLSLRLGPDLKFGPVNVNLFEAKTEIIHHNTFPIIQAFGLGESKPYWQFAHHSTHPLLGCQSVYLVLSSPLCSGGTQVLVELAATAETRFGPLRLGLPQSANAHVNCIIA